MGKHIDRYYYEPGDEELWEVMDRAKSECIAETNDVETAQIIVEALNARDKRK